MTTLENTEIDYERVDISELPSYIGEKVCVISKRSMKGEVMRFEGTEGRGEDKRYLFSIDDLEIRASSVYQCNEGRIGILLLEVKQ